MKEKDQELKEIAKRMQQWKVTTARSLALKLEQKIAAELEARRETNHNSTVEKWLSNNHAE